MKPFVSLLAVAIIVVLSITLISSGVAGQTNITSLTYAGVSDGYAPPIISFSSGNGNVANGAVIYESGNIENGSIIYESGNFNIPWMVNTPYQVYGPSEQDTLMTLFLALTSVSYKASWQGNQTIDLYNFNIPTPAIWTGNPHNSQSRLSYNLTNIPYGHQQIQVTASCGGYITNFAQYESFSTTSSNTLDFTIEAPPTVTAISPENRTYNSKSIPLLFSVSGDYATLEYSLDNLANVTIAGNTTLTGLSYGYHSLVVYADDTFGNTVASKTIYFTIAQQGVNPLYLFPILVVIFVIVLLIALIIYRKRQLRTKLSENK